MRKEREKQPCNTKVRGDGGGGGARVQIPPQSVESAGAAQVLLTGIVAHIKSMLAF